MNQNMPLVGVRFDIDKLIESAGGSGLYGPPAWRILWDAIDPRDIPGTDLFNGDTEATLRLLEERVFVIAAQNRDRAAIKKIKAALSRSDALKQVCASPQFVEGRACATEPLPLCGKIDAKGIVYGIDVPDREDREPPLTRRGARDYLAFPLPGKIDE